MKIQRRTMAFIFGISLAVLAIYQVAYQWFLNGNVNWVLLILFICGLGLALVEWKNKT